uniref:VWFC domain-containing protein n=1 Tax=Macrostomum lignano TaxID=282301 RepID=A0A1I8JCT9_9PLAT
HEFSATPFSLNATAECPSKPLLPPGPPADPTGAGWTPGCTTALRKCVCHQRVKRLRLRCRCPKPTKRRKCVKHRSFGNCQSVAPSHSRCLQAVGQLSTDTCLLPGGGNPNLRPMPGRTERPVGWPAPDHVREAPDPELQMPSNELDVKKIPCACHLLNYRTKRCENKKKRFVIRDYRFTEGAERCKKTVKTTNVPIKCDENRSEHKSACGKRGYQTVTLTYHKLVSCACVKKHKKRRVICRCPKTKVELKPDPKLKWNRKCTTVYRLNREKNRCDKKNKMSRRDKAEKKCAGQSWRPLKAGPCNKETGFQTTELTIGRVVLLPPPQNRYACLVKKVKMKRRCTCPKPARTVKCRRNVLITVTVTQKLKGQKCIKAKKVDKKATKCPKNSISETKCRSDNTKVVTKVTYRKRNCKCERKVKHRRVLCRCPDPIISTRCVRHTIKERSTVSYQLKSERCRRKKQVSKKKIKCKGGTKVTRTKCDKRCNQKVTKVTRYIRNCECRKKTDISSVKCCCPKSVTRVACIDDSRRVVTTTSWRLVRGACQRKARKREKKI